MYAQTQTRNRQKQRTILAVAVAALVPLAAACGSERADDDSGSVGSGGGKDVTGVHWSVDSVTVDGKEHRAADGAHVTIGADGTAEGSYGCNDFHAKATVDGDRVRLSDAESTAMACEG
ncbi:META domain-containing protein [Streptomyces sp. CRN 30]|uniref:META domain-containing protein n=1 Tax=Streptomyces sp. CRN 30 TaxID=3075613 RepID=UPI002A81692B|nr:META domain-containing protein [Streptomyces sp. CRN 30]